MGDSSQVSQLVQVMAGSGGGSGAADGLNIAAGQGAAVKANLIDKAFEIEAVLAGPDAQRLGVRKQVSAYLGARPRGHAVDVEGDITPGDYGHGHMMERADAA